MRPPCRSVIGSRFSSRVETPLAAACAAFCGLSAGFYKYALNTLNAPQMRHNCLWRCCAIIDYCLCNWCTVTRLFTSAIINMQRNEEGGGGSKEKNLFKKKNTFEKNVWHKNAKRQINICNIVVVGEQSATASSIKHLYFIYTFFFRTNPSHAIIFPALSCCLLTPKGRAGD